MAVEPVKFLMVDDLEENLVALEALLRREGLELVKARSGAEALEMLLVHDISLALLDVQMPEMNGFELAELMRGPERTRNIPIIFVTALPADEKRRFHGYEMGAVDYLQKPVDPQVLASKTGVFFELARQRQELRAKAEQLSHALEDLQAHTDASPLACVRFDAELRVVSWSAGARRLFGWREEEVIGRPFTALPWLKGGSATELRETAAALARGEGNGQAVREMVARDGQGREIAAEWYFSAPTGRRRDKVFLSAQILDVTERKKAEQTQRLLIGELNHRVKNTLATVQAMASQTLKHTLTPQDFARTFTGRIHALSKAHSLLSAATWEGACLSELVREQLGLGALDPARFDVDGPAVQLKPQQALHFALIIHELATNATKYGAHSVPEGHVSASWTLDDDMLTFTWRESGGPPAVDTGRRGFGTTLIEHSARAESGEAALERLPDGLRWTISMRLPEDEPGGSGEDGETAGEAADAAGQSFNKRILIVEDEPLVALDIEAALQGRGYEVAAIATSVREAFDALGSSSVDLVLLDGNLRGHPVDEVADALRDRAIPFLFVSGYGRESLPVDFNDIPILQKPFDHEQLVHCVDSLMDNR